MIKSMTVIFIALTVVLLYWSLDLGHLLSFTSLKSNQQVLDRFYQTRPFVFTSIYVIIYILATALSIPGAVVLTLAGGAVFGFWKGLVFISFASTVGATLAFLTSRFFLREWVQNRFKNQWTRVRQGMEREGAFYLFTLRLIPVVPFFLINLLMGLTPMKTRTYFLISQIGMLPGTMVYVNAGTQLGKMTSLSGLLTPQILGSFLLIALLPWAGRFLIQKNIN